MSARFTADQLPAKYQAQVAAQLHGTPPTPPKPAIGPRLASFAPIQSYAHPHPDSPAPRPVVERRPRPRPLAASQAQDRRPARFLVRITSFRRRLLDEDNLCEKYFCDCCRYAGLIPADSPDVAKIEVAQVKVAHKSDEKTVVEITIP